MFGFESLSIYKRARNYNLQIRSLLKQNKIDYPSENQLRRAALSVQLNIAEGNSRFSPKDIRHFYVISRSSIHECVAVLDLLHEERAIENSTFYNMKNESEEISKILFKIIRGLSN